MSLSWWGWGSCYESVVVGAPFTPAGITAEAERTVAERRVAHSTQSRATLHCDVTCGRFKHRVMSGTEWFCGVQLGGVKFPAEFPAARNSKSMVHAGTGRWRQKNGRPMLMRNRAAKHAVRWCHLTHQVFAGASAHSREHKTSLVRCAVYRHFFRRDL